MAISTTSSLESFRLYLGSKTCLISSFNSFVNHSIKKTAGSRLERPAVFFLALIWCFATKKATPPLGCGNMNYLLLLSTYPISEIVSRSKLTNYTVVSIYIIMIIIKVLRSNRLKISEEVPQRKSQSVS